MAYTERLEALTPEQLREVHGGISGPLWETMEKGREFGLNIHYLHTGPHYENSRHWNGQAVDLGGSDENMSKLRDWALQQPTTHEVIFKKGWWVDGVKRKGFIPGHDKHIHISVK